ncbi:MAG: IS30 family transposase [Mycobacterium sp.]|nr:IS30 family transposase [Mycobacterium sp.]
MASKLAEEWSPEQISGWLVQQYTHETRLRVCSRRRSTAACSFRPARAEEGADQPPGYRRTMRRSNNANTSGQGRGGIVDAVAISERPPQVEDRAVPGHWEGDRIVGAKNTLFATLVERHSRFVMLVKVNGKDTDTVVAALLKQVNTLPAQLRSTPTWKRGIELAENKRLSIATDVKVSFCDPRSPWHRGSNEKTNGLLRPVPTPGHRSLDAQPEGAQRDRRETQQPTA